MKKTLLIFFATIFVILACNKATIEKEDFMDILYQIEFLKVYPEQDINKNDYLGNYLDSLGYTKQDFKESVNFYTSNPKILRELYEQIYQKIELKKLDLEKKMLEKKQSDSLKTNNIKQKQT